MFQLFQIMSAVRDVDHEKKLLVVCPGRAKYSDANPTP